VVDGPHAHLYDRDNDSWVKLMNWQHSTMYLFFGISGIALVASTSCRLIPVGVDRLALSFALFVEGKLEKLWFGLVVLATIINACSLELCNVFDSLLSPRISVLLPCARSTPSGRSHPLPATGGCVWWVSQHHAGGV